ncbi:unnamed protein product [Rotaria sordida]|uniref:Uncharacterized protein n=1 Tax=Rotaria sordida TaxID=392033 RepID=A0A814EVC1_9BILA|nr:unnamed protein product [Rotaria sordida]
MGMVLPLPTTTRSSALSKYNGGLKKYLLLITPICNCLTEEKNKCHLNAASIIFSVVYMVLFLFCGFAAKECFHTISNITLNDIKTLEDVYQYFSTPVKETNVLEDLQ